jgi:hypothetical protein
MIKKLMAGTVAGLLLLGASGAAMAVDCPDGSIVLQEVDEIVINGQPCYINDVVVAGDVTITDSPNVDMIDVDVNGTVVVTGTGVENAELNATLVNIDVFAGDIQVDGQATAIVAGSILRAGGGPETGNLVVNNNAAAIVRSNLVPGDLTCDGNLELDANLNRVFGTEDCIEEVVP